ncbi:NEW3 domain-containing protein [Candidatus Bipolaricaulota bacterium]|nr:NEW3 domain-containing protein [Candidatus Bipolaricaulota bacterium]
MGKGRGLVLAVTMAVVLTALGFAQTTQRGFEFYTQYPSLEVFPGREVSLEIKLQNTGALPEDVTLTVSGPEDWEARFETASFPILRIRGVHLLPGEDPLTIRFKARPPEGAAGGDYQFILEAATADGAIRRTLQVMVSLLAEEEEPAEEPEEVLQLLVDYPSLEGAAGEDFTFTIQIRNRTDQDQMVDLAGRVPAGWRAYFTPRWQQDTRITSIKVNANSTENIRFVVTPPYGVEQGDYPLTFVAQAGDYQATLELKAVVTGTYDLGLASEAEVTGAGDTWNIKAVEGRERVFVMYLYNRGSAPITNIKFFATEPEGWEVEFRPDTVESLPPTLTLNDLGTVEVMITPPERAIPGDYQIRITASGAEDHATAQLRVTVGASVGWGWIGVGVVVFVVAGLTAVFVRLGRR